MSGASPHFWRQPIRYCRWAAHEKPALFFSVLIGVSGPLVLVFQGPIQRTFGIKKRPHIPSTYPVPTGPRKIPEGFDDP